MRRAILCAPLLAGSVAHADDAHPTGFVGRTTPGLGYAIDSAAGCDVQGRKFVGGFELTYAVRPGLLVGVATAIDFITLPANAACSSDGARLTFGFVLGPAFQLYLADRLHAHAVVGLATIDDGDAERYGVGGALAIGYDLARVTGPTGGRLLVGLRLQVAAQQVDDHRVLVPALLGTFGID